MSSLKNYAALIKEKGGKVVVDEAPIEESLKDNEVLIKVESVALNPIDIYTQRHGAFIKQYPSTTGYDLAGVVVKLGPNLDESFLRQNIKVGDRVTAFPPQFVTGENRHAAFQKYSTVWAHATSKVPDNVNAESASTVAICVATAAAGLFDSNHLNIKRPDPKTKGHY
ncbi:zinc-binding alcohol dehydrogenase domain-containing protein cipB [Acrasis kona]|uniref:Zinc-binding alcohol dehydrogenase domain-containing protein cipB n=1 Tax=Acrasis kona TaxID=1008807 RepID=A0AAW2ZLA0_9EUKA